FSPPMHPLPYSAPDESFDASFRRVFGNQAFRSLAKVFLFSSMATSIPATLVLFYVEGVLGAKQQSGYFLAAYFLSGAVGMPLWVWLANKYGKKHSWMLAMFGSVSTFLWAFLLRRGDVPQFYAVCLPSGLFMGADLALPPSILADTLKGNPRSARYF